MRKLSEIKGEEAIDVLAEILVPIVDIWSDEEVKKGYEDKNVAKAVSVALKKYHKEIIGIFATLDGKTYEEECKAINLVSLPADIIELLNEPAIKSLFM